MLIMAFIIFIIALLLVSRGLTRESRSRIIGLVSEAQQASYYNMKQPNKRPFEFDLRKKFPILNKIEEKLSSERMRQKIIAAGSPINIVGLILFRFVCLSAVPSLAWIFFKLNAGVLIILGVAGFCLPELWLKSKIKKRHREISRDLPNVIDILNLCVGAGLDFMVAVNRVIKEFKPCSLTKELSEVAHEIQLGRPRHEAFKHFAWCIDMPEVYSFAYTLIQADKMGYPIADVLKNQAEDLRIRRFQKGEILAQKAPIKLLFPLLIFILPVVLIIVAGPIIIQFSKGGIKF